MLRALMVSMRDFLCVSVRQSFLFILSIDILQRFSYCLFVNAPKAMIDYSRFSWSSFASSSPLSTISDIDLP